MADRYLVGSSWGSTSSWSTVSGGAGGASVPTSADNAFLDASSPSNVSLSGACVCNNLDCTGYTRTLSGTGTLTIYGNCTFSSAMTYSLKNTITFAATSTGKTVNLQGKNVYAISFNGAGGGWTIDSSGFSATASGGPATDGVWKIYAGAVSIPATTIVVNRVDFSEVSATRSLSLGSSSLIINGGSGVTTIFTGSTNSFTFTPGTSAISYSNFFGTPYIFNAGGMGFYNVTLPATAYDATSGTSQLVGDATYNNLTISNGTSGAAQLVVTGTHTVSGTLSVSSGSVTTRTLIYNTTNTAATFSAAAVTLANADFHNVTGSGAAAPFTGSSLGDCGLNSGITFTSPKTVYWNLAAGGAWTANAWATTSGGSPSTANFPIAQDTAIIENTGLNTSATITFGLHPMCNIDCSTRTTAAAVLANGFYGYLAGNITTGSSVTIGRSVNYRTATLKSNIEFNTASTGLSLDIFAGINLVRNTTLTSVYGINLYGGTFAANTYNVTFIKFTTPSTVTRTTVINMGSGTWTFQNSGATTPVWLVYNTIPLTINCNTSTIYTTGTGFSFTGGGFTYNVLSLSSSTTGCAIYGSNTFANLTSSSTSSYTLTIQSGTTQNIGAWNINGTAGNLATVQSSSTTNHTLNYTGSGTVTANYLNISKSTATPTLTWLALNSYDLGGLSGWYFNSFPTGSAGLFFGSNF